MSEQKMILEMLRNGDISAEEAERLLYALRGKKKQQGTASGSKKEQSGDDFREHMERVFKNVNKLDISKAVRDFVKTAERRGFGEMVGKIVEEVKDVAQDLANQKVSRSASVDLSEDTEDIDTLEAVVDNGWIELTATDQESVNIRAVKRITGPDEDKCREWLEQVEVCVSREGKRLIISKSGPKPEADYSGNIDFKISCPARFSVNLVSENGHVAATGTSAHARLISENGDVRLKGSAGLVKMKTTNGNVFAGIGRISAPAELKTVNGSISMTVTELAASLSAESLNGSINMTLPSVFQGKIAAETSAGVVQCGLDVTGDIGPTRVTGTVGQDETIEVGARTRNGSIHIKKG